jgi:hypothetical protein
MNPTFFADPPPASRWDNALLEPLAELNEEVLEALLAPPTPGLLAQPGSLAWQWRGLSPEARRRAAACPFLLLDLGFSRAGLWRGGSGQLARGTLGVAEAVPVARLGSGLLHRALLFAWHLARANRQAARITLAMGPQAADALAAWRMGELEQLALQQPAWLQPRWADRPALWQAWLAAAAFDRRPELERLRLWGIQMLAAEVLQGGVG